MTVWELIARHDDDAVGACASLYGNEVVNALVLAVLYGNERVFERVFQRGRRPLPDFYVSLDDARAILARIPHREEILDGLSPTYAKHCLRALYPDGDPEAIAALAHQNPSWARDTTLKLLCSPDVPHRVPRDLVSAIAAADPIFAECILRLHPEDTALADAFVPRLQIPWSPTLALVPCVVHSKYSRAQLRCQKQLWLTDEEMRRAYRLEPDEVLSYYDDHPGDGKGLFSQIVHEDIADSPLLTTALMAWIERGTDTDSRPFNGVRIPPQALEPIRNDTRPLSREARLRRFDLLVHAGYYWHPVEYAAMCILAAPLALLCAIVLNSL